MPARRFVHLTLFTALLCTATVAAVQADLRPDPLNYVAPSRDYDVVHTVVDLDLDLEAQTVAGSVTHSLKPLKDRATAIRLNCVGLAISRVTIDGRECEFEYPVPGQYSTSWIEVAEQREASDELVVYADPPLPRGEQFDLKVEYSGAPKIGLYFIAPEKGIKRKRYEVWSQGEGEDNRYWIPSFDYPNDKATYEGIYRVNKDYYCLSNGVLVEEKEIGDKKQYHWHLDTPQVNYLIMVAAGEYEIYEEMWRDVPLTYIVPPGTGEEATMRAYHLTADMLEFMSNKIGIDYPFKKYAQVSVQNFIYGGMENTTATVMTDNIHHDASIELTRTHQQLVAHEVAHQWWGDMVTCGEWSQMWLNEGFATYWEALYREHHNGRDEMLFAMDARRKVVAGRDDNNPLPLVVDFYNRADGRNSANVYSKGSLVLHMLRAIIGDDAFFAVMKHYGEERKYQTAVTSDFTRAVTEVTGENLDWFFEQWVYLAGHPKLNVSQSWEASTNTLKLSVEQTQETGDLWPVFRLPIDVQVTCDDGATTYNVIIDKASQEFYFNCPSKPKMVLVDKDDIILKTLSFSKSTDELLYQLEHANTMSRARAAMALGKQSGEDRVVDAITAVALGDEHFELRRKAAAALGAVANDAAREALLQVLEVDEARVRLAAAAALRYCKTDDDIDRALMKTLREDAAWEVRAQAVTSLVAMESDLAEKACIDAVKQDAGQAGREAVRVAGLKGMAALKDPDLLGKIKPYTGPGNRRGYRHTAITSYAKLAKELDKEKDRERASEFLADMLDDWYLRTRRTVVQALGTLSDPSAVEPLRQMAKSDPIEDLRVRAARVANRIETKSDGVAKKQELETDIKSLQDQIKALQKELKVLQARVPQSGEDNERISQKGTGE